jgi:hypothetical protein
MRKDQKCDPDFYRVSHSLGFDEETVTREELLAWHKIWEPRGSGNLLAGRLGCTIIHLIVKYRDLPPFTQEEIAAYSPVVAREFLVSIGKLKD